MFSFIQKACLLLFFIYLVNVVVIRVQVIFELTVWPWETHFPKVIPFLGLFLTKLFSSSINLSRYGGYVLVGLVGWQEEPVLFDHQIF